MRRRDLCPGSVPSLACLQGNRLGSAPLKGRMWSSKGTRSPGALHSSRQELAPAAVGRSLPSPCSLQDRTELTRCSVPHLCSHFPEGHHRVSEGSICTRARWQSCWLYLRETGGSGLWHLIWTHDDGQEPGTLGLSGWAVA